MTNPEPVGRALAIILTDHPGDEGDSRAALVQELLEEGGFIVDGSVPVPLDEIAVRNALNTAVIGGVDLVITVGGVGVGARDIAPEATEDILDRKLTGIEEALRASGLAAGATDAGLSRGLAGVSGSTVVLNLAPSRAAIRDGMATVIPLARHVIAGLSSLEE